MKIKNIFSLLLLLATTISFCQNITFQGIVKDTTNAPLEMANVMAINQVTKTVDSYSITNNKGKFQLSLKPNANYNIKFSYLGLKTKSLVMATKAEDISQTITLNADVTELAGVEIVREMPVSIKGDTIIYNADSFKTGTERKLEDVLKKLPGVTVNKDGEVEVEGKKVSKLMVEGKDFFDGDTKLGVKNIPADAIDKVQVLRNYNEVGALKSLENNEDNVAINIKLKSGKKNFWFGDMTAAIGVGHIESRHEVNPKLFYYSPKYSVNVLGNFNNIGELPFTVQDYFKFTGGFKNMMKKGGTNFNISSNDLGISLLRNDKAKEIETKFGATNFSYNPIKTLSISGFVILSATETNLETKNQTNYLNADHTTRGTEKRNEITHQKSNLALYKLSGSYKPNAKLQIDYDALAKQSKQDENNNLSQDVFEPNSIFIHNQDIITNKKQNPFSLNQCFNAYYTKSDKNVFALEVQHLHQNENPFYNANLENQPFLFSGYVLGEARNNINQNRFIKTNKTDSKLDYYDMLTPKSNINITLGNTYSYQSFNSNIFQILDNGTTNNINSVENRNDVKYSFNDVFLGLHYKFLTGKFTFNPGLSVHKYNTTDAQLGTNLKNDFYSILPDVYALYQIKKSETLTYNYGLTTDFTDINKFATGNVFSSYNSLFKGNRRLENTLLQNHSLRYFKYNMFNFENIFASISYSRKVNPVKNASVFLGINQVSTAVNSNFADESISGAANYERSFLRYYKASLALAGSWSKFNNIQNNLTQTNESLTQNYTIKGSTNYKNLPNIELGYNYLINDYQNSKFYTKTPSVKIDYYFLDAFSFVSEYEFYNYANSTKTVKNEYDFLTASLIYQKKEGKTEYKISGTNLLNTTSLNDDKFDQVRISTSQYTVQPRYLIFSLKYNL
ncbi:carboxypeptidase regulatory-like domain-containing protein [Flavobacterium psychrophilum]|uniref:Carboxypeptidase-like regulatory domain-containing protein n=1 Tax=Flavobacterium psychrophilum TaxID=96345 RepID=A0A7U2NG52_FLAPS|nr:carboxypeptidase regulatory-like domain-containing protein [Flavobacterium psychrophilum]QRE04544.1 carboxypeptidase-like regulatory domain-containing protein [Flavobacterium psychrophilum]